MACFQAQQAAEKALKSLIIPHGGLPDVRERALYFFSDSLPVQPFVMPPSEIEERIENAQKQGVFRLQRVKDGWKFDADAAEAAGI